jgi:integrase
MSDQIKVSVVEFGDRRHYMMQWRDPVTGRKKSKSTKVERTGRAKERKEAERKAAKFEAELREGRYHEPLRVTWSEFRERYELEALTALAAGTDQKAAATLNWVERVLKPARLADVTESRVSHLQAEMRRAGLAEQSIKGHLAHLGAALRWAARLGLLVKAPRIEPPKRAKDSKLMKGRPITGEEFDRMLAVVPKALNSRTRGRKPLPACPEAIASWQHYLRGLWLSGLRLSESLELWWDRDDRLCVDLSGEFPMLRIPAVCEKGNQDRLLPMAPEFAEFLLATLEAERTGPVFKPVARRVHGERLGWQVVSRFVCKIGKAAGVKVATKIIVDAKTGERAEVVKYASAHDLRRSFGERWATRIMPAVLQALMRHESIETTLRYYVGRNAQNTARVLWDAHKTAVCGNTSGNSRQTGPEVTAERSSVTLEARKG